MDHFIGNYIFKVSQSNQQPQPDYSIAKASERLLWFCPLLRKVVFVFYASLCYLVMLKLAGLPGLRWTWTESRGGDVIVARYLTPAGFRTTSMNTTIIRFFPLEEPLLTHFESYWDDNP